MKTISSLIRRRMLLDLEEKGLSDKELKEKYNIADNRTLRKHLGLAEKEREAKEARIKILAENQAQHLAEISNQRRQRGQSGFQVVACIDGRGFGVRREDMRKLLAAAQGKVFTLKTLDYLIENTDLQRFSSAP